MGFFMHMLKSIPECIAVFFCILLIGCRGQKEISSKSNNVDFTTLDSTNNSPLSERLTSTSSDPLKSFKDSILSGYIITKELDGMVYTYKLVDSVPEILQKVFPDIQIAKITQGILNASESYSVIYHGKSYGSYASFNQLSDEVENTKVSFQDRVTALIYLFEGIEKNIIIEEVDNYTQSNSKIECTPNYIIKAIINNSKATYYLEEKDGKLIYLVKQYGSHGYSLCLPFQ